VTGEPNSYELLPTIDLTRDPHPLRGRAALVTGVSRRIGIGFATARRLVALGASVAIHHHRPHDADQPWGADPGGPEAVVDGVAAARALTTTQAVAVAADLAEPDGPVGVMTAAVEAVGSIDILVCNHARSGSDGPLGTLDADMLDSHWAVNTRSTLLLVQEFAARHDGRPGGRVILLTSGQNQGPMPDELAYATSKGALVAITPTLADALADREITVNTVNPGPVDTGWASPELLEQIRPAFPAGRWGEPDDPARLIAWLVTDEARWITGQVINTEGGFRRWR
jgi:3-oxoacyl-[acyl-carrier protein] reductase